jgi:iron complex outermembrane receptor protein
VYLWSDFRFDGDRDFGDNRLAGLPEHYYRAELMYEHPSGFYAGPNVEWVPKRYNVDFAETLFADPYALLGFKIGFRCQRGFSVFVEARNLTDETYAATTGVIARATDFNRAQFLPGDGRSFFGGVEWKW